MANKRRGEVDVVLGGRTLTMCLSLGALAELEQAFGVGSLGELGAGFASVPLSARNLTAIIAAGLRGAGHDLSNEDVAALPVENVAELARAAMELLGQGFGGSDSPNP